MSWLQFSNISKRFPGVIALDQVSFGVERGSCHALIGENGAGKSTLGKILAGVCTADSGEINLNGTLIRPANPLEARAARIAIVHQELAFCPNLSVAENLCLGNLPRKNGFVRKGELDQKARAMLAQIDAPIDVDLPINRLTTGQEQMVQIAAAIGIGAEIIVMDEPTSSLSARESEHLFDLLKTLRERRITVIYVSHRMEEIFRLCDAITVLRDGRHVSTESIAATNPQRVIQQMVGRDVMFISPRHLERDPGEEKLVIEKLSSHGKFHAISFRLREGEILGLAGLVGAGRSEVAQAIFGMDPDVTGTIAIDGVPVKISSPKEALRFGIGFLPEDRKRQGLVLSMNCRENLSLVALSKISKGGFVQRAKERIMASDFLAKLRVKTPEMDAPISGLSGGNQQKIALAKWLARRCRILIVDEPTRGVDVGAKAEIHQLLDALACEGVAILLISSELPELINLSGRIIVLREGMQMGELKRPEFSQGSLMQLMAGVTLEPA